MRTRAVLAACALLVAGCGGAPDAAPSPAPSQRTPSSPDADPSATPATESCPPGGLVLAAGPTDAALGLRVLPLQIRNCGDETRFLEGYPQLTVYQDGGPAKTYTTVHGGTVVDPGASSVVLAPGRRAWASLSWRNTMEDIGIDPIEGDAIVVRMPDGTRQSVPVGIDLGTTALVELTAWQRGKPQARS